MNETYIKRLILLNDLGIEINPNIKKCIDIMEEGGINFGNTENIYDNTRDISIKIGDHKIGYYSRFFNIIDINDISLFRDINEDKKDLIEFIKYYIEGKFEDELNLY